MTSTRGNIITLGVIVIILIIGVFFAWSSIQKNKQSKMEATPAGTSLSGKEGSPYTDVDGNPVELSDFLGGVLVVSSWASWCPFCANEMSKLAEISREYKDSGVKVIAINRAEPAVTAQRFLEYANVSNEIMLILDPDDRYFKSIDGYTMPETVVYDQKGNIVHHRAGEMSLSDMRLFVDQALYSLRED